MEKSTRRARRQSTGAPDAYGDAARPPRASKRLHADQEVHVYGPEYADDAPAGDASLEDRWMEEYAPEHFDGAFDDEEPEYADGFGDADSYEEPGPPLPPDAGKAHRFVEPRLYHSAPVHRYEEESPNPTPARKWPLYLAVTITALLVFVAINVEQSRQEAAHWAAPDATGVDAPLVPREAMGLATELPTRVPQSHLEEQIAAFAVSEELPTPTPFVTEPPIVHTPQPTSRPLLKKGMQGDFIKTVQERLVELNYLDPKEVDGKYGDSTVKAVKEFQENNYLLPSSGKADGMVGEQTYDVLFGPNAVSAPTPKPRLDEPYVWATQNGTYYHSRADCRNMKGATEMPLSEAKAMRKRPCDRCRPPQ
ncbi:MAG: peptidoglycan-binding protein [Clostridia bacterium]|nr:peptidoglycan-binding protein [Clostridia bacterium]